jgi:hypothetical protein
MRDAESIDIALKAAETGHLVFSTVHTTDAAKTIGRITSVFPAEEQLFVRNRIADNLKATISQRLLPRADGKGRAVALEIMVITPTIQEDIRDPSRTDGIKDALEKGRQQVRDAVLRPAPHRSLPRERHHAGDGCPRRDQPERFRARPAFRLATGSRPPRPSRCSAAEDPGGESAPARSGPGRLTLLVQSLQF